MLELDRPKPIQHSLLIDWIVNAYYSQAVPATSLSPGSPLLCPLNNRNKKKETATYFNQQRWQHCSLIYQPQTLIIDAGSLICSWGELIKLDKAKQQNNNMIKQKLVSSMKNLLSTWTTHTRNQCKVIFLSNQKNRSLPGPTMSSEVISRLWILEMTANQTRNHQGRLYKI